MIFSPEAKAKQLNGSKKVKHHPHRKISCYLFKFFLSPFLLCVPLCTFVAKIKLLKKGK